MLRNMLQCARVTIDGVWTSNRIYSLVTVSKRLPLSCSGQATDPKVPGWIPSVPDFLNSSGSGMGSIQPCEDKLGAT
jgi:hypothetical protein